MKFLRVQGKVGWGGFALGSYLLFIAEETDAQRG